MLSHKRIDLICIIVVVCGLILTLLFMNGEVLGIQKIIDEDSAQYEGTEYFSSNDLNGSIDEDKAQAEITMEGDSVSVKGNGVYVLDGDIYITGGGIYIFTGTLNDGRIIVDAYNSSKIWLVMKGTELHCTDDAAIIVEQAEKVFLNLAEGTENTVTCADTYSEQAVAEEHTGAIFARDDLTINGNGSLTVYAPYRHGIVSKDDLVITGGNLTVEAAEDALKANKNISMTNVLLNLTAGDDGLMVNKEEGSLYLESGTIHIISEGDAINSLGDVTIAGGTVTIEAGDDGIHSDSSIAVTGGTILIRECYEGLEAITVDISAGDITICSSDDGINANGGAGDAFGMGMGGGAPMGMSPQSAGESAEEETPGESAGREGTGEFPEGETPGESAGREGTGEFPEGETPGESAGKEGTGESPEGEPPGESAGKEGTGEFPEGEYPGESAGREGTGESAEGGTPEELSEEIAARGEDAAVSQISAEDTWIRISGGNITIVNETGMDADGLDSNGNVYIDGGTILISLEGNGMNNAIDYGSESGGICEINGGLVVAAGNNSMGETISDTSAQCSLMYHCSELTDANTAVSVTNTEGLDILYWEVPCGFTSVILSCPDMVQGETYTIAIGEEEMEITLEDTVSSYGNGNSMSGNSRGGFPGSAGTANNTDDQ